MLIWHTCAWQWINLNDIGQISAITNKRQQRENEKAFSFVFHLFQVTNSKYMVIIKINNEIIILHVCFLI